MSKQNNFFWNEVGSVFIGVVFSMLVIYFIGAEIFQVWEELPVDFLEVAIITILVMKCFSFIGWYLTLNKNGEGFKYYEFLAYGYAFTVAISIIMLDFIVYPDYNISVLYTLIVPFGWFLACEGGTMRSAFWSSVFCLGTYFIIEDSGDFSNFFFHRFGSLVVIVMVGVFLKYFKRNKNKLKKTNVILSQKIIEAELKSKEMEQYLYTVSHDLKEPLRSLSLILDIFIKSNKGKIIPEDLELLDLVKGSTLKMGKSIEAILDYSKLGQNFSLEKVNINKVVNDVLFKIDDEIKDLDIKFEIQELGDLTVYLSDFQLLITHLISNSILYRKEGITCEISISKKEVEGFVIFYFKDNGKGIEKVNHERIFKIFQTLKADSSRKGIGLAHCSKIAELHKGSIRVESELGKGSTFIVRISKDLL